MRHVTAAFYTALLCRVMAIGLVMESAVETTERRWEVGWRRNGAPVSSELYGGMQGECPHAGSSLASSFARLSKIWLIRVWNENTISYFMGL